MPSTSVSSYRQKKTAGRDAFLAPALGVSIAIAIFAVVTQSLDATGAISLSTTQQLTMWLVAVGLIVVLWIAYMICSAYVTARTVQAKAEQARAAAEANARLAEAPAVSGSHWKDGSAEEDEDAWIPPDELRHLDGIERSVSTAKMFPHGCYLQPDSISEAEDYDEKTDTDATVVDITRPRARVYQCKVVDPNPALKDRSHETVVILDQKPSLPPGARYPLVEFEGLMITPHVTDRSPVRMGFTLHATSIRPAAGQAKTA